MMNGKISTIVVMILAIAGAAWLALSRRENTAGDDSWVRVLAFDVTRRRHDFKSDLGNHQLVVAHWHEPVGWEVAVYAYPVTEDSDNLLAGDGDWRGPQPWQSFAMTRRKKLYPDVRIVEYGPPGQKLKLVLKDCKTEQQDGVARFIEGRIEIYYHAPRPE